jgi:ElaB/YqjD/DUF883 family membrane-anchored ribosome-binding protein
MLQSAGMALNLMSGMGWIAQVPVVPRLETPEEAALVLDGPQFFIAVIAGVFLAFAFQLLLTNLGVAVGVSALGGDGDSDNTHNTHDTHDNTSIGSTIRKIGFFLGLATLISVTVSLFFACLLAVKLSLLISPGLGAIVGLVIWAVYFSLLVWISSTTVGSLVGSVVNTATSGLQAIVGTATAAIGGGAASRQVVATAEAAASAVRRELGSAIDPVSIRENIEDYFGSLRPPELDLQGIRREFEDIINDPELKTVANRAALGNIDRQTFVDLVSSRSDLSPRDLNRIADQLEEVWKNTVNQLPDKEPNDDILSYLRSAASGNLIPDEFNRRIDQLIDAIGSNRGQGQGQQSQNPSTGPLSQAMTLGVNSLIGMILGRTDLSDFDVEAIVNRLRGLRDQASEQAGKVTNQLGTSTSDVPYSTVRADIENYLLNAYPWQMKQENLGREFRDVLYDPAADPGSVAYELEQINRGDFADLLAQKGMFTQVQITELSNRLENIRLEVLSVAQAAQTRERSVALMAAVESYLLNTPKENFTPEKIALEFKPLLEDSEADYEDLSTRLAQFDRSTFERLLNQRDDLTQAEKEALISTLEHQRDRALSESREQQEAVRAKVEAQWLKVQSYLRDTGRQELNPEDINRELQVLLRDPQAGLALMRNRAAHFDRNTLASLLTERSDLNEDQVHQTIDQVERVWSRIRHTPGNLTGKAKDQYDQVTTSLTDYLRNTGKEELNPDGIRRDLTTLLNNPQVGAVALRQRLGRMDRDTLVKLLTQRGDLTEEQVNQTIAALEDTLRTVIRAPRRLATRTQTQVRDFQSTIEDYLRNTGKDELNPDGIKRDLQLLLNDPRAGAYSLGDRLSHFDRETLIALLSQRQDVSESEVKWIVDNILSVREQINHQIQSVQNRVQSVVDGIIARIRNYLNSLERPELNYDGIMRDMRTLFDDPQAGFDALRDRLGQFDRETLVAVLSSREDISESDVNRIFDSVDRARNNVLQRAERIQAEAQRRVEEVKHQAQRQAEETRKAAATAAWWLFGTALASAIASAIAGVLAVAAL